MSPFDRQMPQLQLQQYCPGGQALQLHDTQSPPPSPPAMLPEPPLASPIAVPPLAEVMMVVEFDTSPPSTQTEP